MDHWLQYHNSHDLGFPTKPSGRYGIFWHKNVTIAKGSTIWLVASERAKPRYRYYLVESFVASAVSEGEAQGSRGSWFGKTIRLDTLDWFPEFFKYMGSFGRGLSPLPPQWVRRLESILPGKVATSLQLPSPARPTSPSSGPSPDWGAMGSLEAERVVATRTEQRAIRQFLLKGKSTGLCVICGSSFPPELLVASHIKPRALCTDAEKRDVENNTALMCTLGCDALFERGFIGVHAGKVIAGPTVSALKVVRSAVARLIGLPCPVYSPRSAKYFRYRVEHPDQ